MVEKGSFGQLRLVAPGLRDKDYSAKVAFVSSKGEVVSAENVQATCRGCQLGKSDAQCLICSTISQADFAQSGKCVWKKGGEEVEEQASQEVNLGN